MFTDEDNVQKTNDEEQLESVDVKKKFSSVVNSYPNNSIVEVRESQGLQKIHNDVLQMMFKNSKLLDNSIIEIEKELKVLSLLPLESKKENELLTNRKKD